MQEYQTLINIGGAAFLAAAGWFAKVIWDAVHRLQEDIHKIEVALPSNYVRKDEFVDAMRTISDKLDKIWDKLENKADR